jgi:pimeloyl-ACP methyl ester carboxylesterase
LVLEPEVDDFGDEAADWVAESIADLAQDRYGVVGVSGGASVAVRHALRSPERVAVLVLVSPLIVSPTNPSDTQLADRLGEIRCPTLAVFGQEDSLVSGNAASVYRERIPNCNIAFVYDAGHAIPTERPAALLNLVADFLERRETFIVQNRSSVISP